ncbi:MAG TPA: MoxR family ATPase [Actinomycetota bacterium]|jgi:MoxR-like ATPase|nr:MoxR family ATPase [Actinomycetota bacterium]
MHQYRFSSAEETRRRLELTGYLADEDLATVVMLADRLSKPLLVEGPAGVGKTELAKALATALALPLVRLQCYEGVDEAKTLYEWNYKKQLLRIQAGSDETWTDLEEDIFSEPFLLERPVLKAIRSPEPVVLLIDEVDKLDIEAEALLLEVLSDWQITIPELGTVSARRIPFVVLTSNNDRELSEALKRRCLFFYLDYPEPAREKAIVLARVPELPETLAAQVVAIVRSIRELELKKPPSIAETLDWATTLLHLNVSTLDDTTIAKTLPVLIKFQSDLEKAGRHLKIAPDHSGN